MTISLSLLRSRWFWLSLVGIVILIAIIALRSSTGRALVETLTPPDLPDIERAENRVYLSTAQNWDEATSRRFHHVSQGTSTLPVPYTWLLALEQAESSPLGLLIPGAKDLFTDAAHLERYGFISAEASKTNPDGLPIGFASTKFQNLSGYPRTTTSVGFTCAACHTGRFRHGDTEYIVEGGPSTIDLQLFSYGLRAALAQTALSSKLPLPNKRFDRFARRVLGDTFTQAGKKALADDLTSVLTANIPVGDVIDVTEGFGRLDALNRIGNQVFSKNTGRRENYQAINAPVNFPHIWTASWFDWVQYDGSIMQPLVRNAGEALGVHANIDMTAPVDKGRFSSAVPIETLRWIERSLSGGTNPAEANRFEGLLSPKWPDALGPIDAALADQGKELYAKHCQGCHLPPLNDPAIFGDRYFKPIQYQKYGTPVETDQPYLKVHVIPQRKIATDPAQANVLALRKVDTAAEPANGFDNMGINATVCTVGYVDSDYGSGGYARPRGAKKALVETPVSDGPMVSFALALGAIVQQVDDRWFEANGVPLDQRAAFEGDRPNCLQAGAGYKARPLNGIWATGPFLHNGSVPTLDDLLRPADQRPTFVRLGPLEFDPVKVGLAQPDLSRDDYPDYLDGEFIVDTRRAGNSNAGHAFGASSDGDETGMIGPALTDQQRKALIEYLKTL